MTISYEIKIPLHDRNGISLSGTCLKKVMSECPIYPLKSQKRYPP